MRYKGKGINKNNRRERGIMVAVAALGLTTFMLAAGMAVDVSNFYAAGTELQNAADAAAMAGATALDSSVAGLDAAVARATSVANTYSLNVAAVNIPASNVTFAANLSQFDNNGTGWNLATAKSSSNFSKVRFVRVQLQPTSVRVYFANMALGGSSNSNFVRRAVAGQSASGTTASGTAGDPGLKSVSNLSRLVLVEDDTSGGTLSLSGSCANNTVYTQGCTYNVNMTPPCDALSATYEVAKGNNSSAGSDMNKQMVIPMSGCYCLESEHQVNTHPNASNIRSGLNTLFNDYSDSGTSLSVPGISSSEASQFPPDKNIREGITYAQYKAGSAATAPSPATRVGVSGRRILIMGIMKKSSWWIDPADATYETATMDTYKYGAFFIRRRPTSSGRLQLEYIGDRITLGSGGSGCPTCPSTPMTASQSSDMSKGLAVPVLYR